MRNRDFPTPRGNQEHTDRREALENEQFCREEQMRNPETRREDRQNKGVSRGKQMRNSEFLYVCVC